MPDDSTRGAAATSTDPPIDILDLGFQGLDHAVAAFLVHGPEGAVLVETGPASTWDALEAALRERGLAASELAAALVTHIHLDHAGAAGRLAGLGVDVHVHPRGARHLVDPTRLLASAERIYGDRMIPLWGTTLPAPAERVHAAADGAIVHAAGLSFEALDTPGHANHHHAWRIGGAVFCGDVGGVRMPGSRLVAVPAVPPELDPTAWRASIARLRAAGPAVLYLTHFGRVDDPGAHLDALSEELEASLAFLVAAAADEPSRDALVERYVEWNRSRADALGVTEAEWERFQLANPFAISVDGVLRWMAAGA